MTDSSIDVVVVGAGQAGLGISYYLGQKGIQHIVLEKARIGESWISQRWDSFQLNTKKELSTLPGMAYEGPESDGFWRADELVDYFNLYAEALELPIKTGIEVTSVKQAADGSYDVHTEDSNNTESNLTAKAIVVASGIQNSPKYPQASDQLPAGISQMHAADYRNADDLPAGAIVVMGSAQTGCQICEDLAAGGRQVYLCTSRVGRVPRRYRGQDIIDWAKAAGFYNITLEQLEDPAMALAAQPQVSGVGRYGRTVSLQSMAQKGVKILGRFDGVEGKCLIIGKNAAENVLFADQVSQQIKAMVDNYLTQAGVDLPPLEADPADEPDPGAKCVESIDSLDLELAQVSTVIWATGFGGNFEWIDIAQGFENARPLHKRGVSNVKGLYFLGFPWLHSRKSGLIFGIEEDALFISEEISRQLAV